MVVGYKGEIGSFILNGLLKTLPKALNIWCVDINETDEEIKQRLDVSNIIFLCVPLQSTLNWLQKYQILLKNKTIIEQCSLKEWLYENEITNHLNVKSMHILYRPSQTPNLEDRKIGLFTNQFDNQTAEMIATMTQSKIVWYNDAKTHDKEMATQQALLHRSLLILNNLLKECNGSTYISKKIMELSTRIKQGNKELYKLIQTNKYLPEILNKMTKDFQEFDLDKIW